MDNKIAQKMNFEEKIKWLKKMKSHNMRWTNLTAQQTVCSPMKRTHASRSVPTTHSSKWCLLGFPKHILTSLVPSVYAAEVPSQTSESAAEIDEATPPAEMSELGPSETTELASLQPPGPILEPARPVLSTADPFSSGRTGTPDSAVTTQEVEAYLALETGRDRLRKMMEGSGGVGLSPEATFLVDSVKTAAFFSFFFGSILGGIKAKDDFIRESKHKKWPTQFRAARAHTDAIVIGGAKAGAYLSLRTCAFVTLFMGTSQAIAVYRNKSGVLEHIAAGFVTGSTLRMHLGLKGWVAGGIIGSALGTVFGVAILGGMKASGETQEEKHYWKIHDELRQKKDFQKLAHGTI